MFGLGPQEMIVVAILGVLLFGKRLPEVGRSLGKGIVEFKKGMRGIEEELDTSTTPSRRAEPSYSYESKPESSVPKFEPPATAPIDATVQAPTYQD
jgi:sec-independent protein translocase protein TatA